MHVVVAPETTVAGVQDIDNVAGGCIVMLVVAAEPSALAVMVTFCPTGPAAAVAWKLAEVAPAGMVTVEGTVKPALPLATVTTAPPAGAAIVDCTTHVETAPWEMVDGVQVSVRPTGIATTVLPLPVVGIGTPDASTAMTPLIPIGLAAGPETALKVAVTIATGPSLITAGFRPYSRHKTDPLRAWHCKDFPAAVAAAAGDTVTAVNSDGL